MVSENYLEEAKKLINFRPLFIVADDKTAAIHSERKIHVNRLFLSILVGDKSEIEEIYLRWHPEINSTTDSDQIRSVNARDSCLKQLL